MKQAKEDKRFRKVEEALRTAYCRREKVEPSPGFDRGVMQTVLTLRPVMGVDERSYERAIWGFSAVSCVVVAIFLFWFLSADSDSAYQIAGLFIDDSIGFDIAETLDIL